MFEEIKNQIRETDDFKEMREALVAKEVGQRIPNKNIDILRILQNDPNTDPFELISKYIKEEEGSIVGIEDLGDYVTAHVHDPNGEEVAPIDMSVEAKPGNLPINKETFESLKELSSDYETIRVEVESRVDKLAI